MGKKNQRYCIRVNPKKDNQWQIWDRKMAKWWGNPSKDFPQQIVDRLNKGGDKSDIKY